MPSYFSYIICHDDGAAPNAENGLLTLAICKPQIRRIAQKGDYIIAYNGSELLKNTKEKRIIYIAKVDQSIPMSDYASLYPERGDSIYTACGRQKPNPFHTESNADTDLSGKNVILCREFIYFGNKHIAVPVSINSTIPGRGHQKQKNQPYGPIIERKFTEWKKTYGMGKIGDYNQKQKKQRLC